MSSSFDLFEERAKVYQNGNKDIFEERAQAYAPQKKPSIAKDIPKQAALGGAKGLFGSYGDILDLIRGQAKTTLPGEQIQRQQEFEALGRLQEPGAKPSLADLLTIGEDEVIPRYSRLPAGKDIEEFAQMLGVETEPETGAGRFAKRAGEAVGSGAAFAASPAVLGAFGLGGLAGQATEEMTGSPMAGAIAELATSLAPSALAARLAPTAAKSKELVKAARKAGLSEKEITPLIQSKKKLSTLSKVARKGSKIKERFNVIENKLGNSYESIKKAASDLPRLNLEENSKLLKGFGEVNKKLKTTLKAAPEREAASKFVQEAMENIRNKGATAEELIGFWGDINNAVNWNAVSGGKKSLAGLKEPIREALQKASPELAKDFEMTNQLYSKFKNASKALKPDIIDKWLNKGEIGGLALGLATLNPAKIKYTAGAIASRQLAKELLTNPRLQNVSNKMLQAVKNNKIQSANQLLRQTQKIMKEKYPEGDWSVFEEQIAE